ncbi:MAG TPA: CDP-alcohol phosphatidyltransferase family protein [Thermomicrobiales bacterium]
MANLITVGRIGLLFVVVALIYFGNVQVITACMALIAIIFALDGVDGWVARRRGETSSLGAVFDIAGDRVVETVLWVAFADLGLIPVWIPFLVITRGIIVDGLRSLSYAEGMTAFGERNMMRSPLTRWLTAGRFMRALYGYAKAVGFVFLTGLEAYEHHDASGTFIGDVYGVTAVRWIGWAVVWLAVALTVIRGVPVIVDALALWGRPAASPARTEAGAASDLVADRSTQSPP